MSDMDIALTFPEEIKDKDKHYCLELDEKKHGQGTATRMIVAHMKGYRPIKATDPEGQALIEREGSLRIGSDGLVRVGDLVLMACQKDEYEKRQADRKLRSNPHRVLSQKKEEFKEAGDGAGLPTFEAKS